jgi:hypothetical protein
MRGRRIQRFGYTIVLGIEIEKINMLLNRARKVWGYAEKIKRSSKFAVAPQMHVKRWGKR